METEKSATQRKKEETKLWMVQLAEKRRKEVAATEEQKEHEGQKFPSPEQEQEMETKAEEGGTDPETTSTQLKC